eukprot:gene12523-15739_t
MSRALSLAIENACILSINGNLAQCALSSSSLTYHASRTARSISSTSSSAAEPLFSGNKSRSKEQAGSSAMSLAMMKLPPSIYSVPGDFEGGTRYLKHEQLWQPKEEAVHSIPPYRKMAWGVGEGRKLKSILAAAHPSLPSDVLKAIRKAAFKGQTPSRPADVANRVSSLWTLSQLWPGLDPVELYRRDPSILKHTLESVHKRMRQYDDEASAQGLGPIGPDFPALASILMKRDPRAVAQLVASLEQQFPLQLDSPFPAAVILLGKRVAADAITKDLTLLAMKPEDMRMALDTMVKVFKPSVVQSDDEVKELVGSCPSLLRLSASQITQRYEVVY